MNPNTPPLFALTPITETEGLEDGRYIVTNGIGRFEVNYDSHYGFHEEFTDCSGLTHYLKPLPPGTVPVSEEELLDLLLKARDGQDIERGDSLHPVFQFDNNLEDIIKQFITTKLAQMGE